MVITVIYKEKEYDVYPNPVYHTFGTYEMEVYQTVKDFKPLPVMYCKVIKYKNVLDSLTKIDIINNIKGLTRDELEYLLIKELRNENS